ncbi:MAG TPA: cupredoxin domain-containing protein [Nitrospira sp.]|nr:cupredoxin domain-containing protein [Nitrospira sp.]
MDRSYLVRGLGWMAGGLVFPCVVATWALASIGTAPVADIAFDTTAPYYHPPLAVVPAGSSIRWINATASPHTVRHDGCLTDEPCAFQSIAVPPDSSFAIAPLPPGRYPYHCELHPIMRGTLIVVESTTQERGTVGLPERSR